jgi:2-isopropylmalate synthase
VIYDAEHFFDGFKAIRGYALQTVAWPPARPARLLSCCATPTAAACPLKSKRRSPPWRAPLALQGPACAAARLGIHAHNDCGLAVANSIAAIRSGAVMVHGTINGYGERCGNADLTSIVPILCTKLTPPACRRKTLKKSASCPAS